jgi:hypothetical protein
MRYRRLHCDSCGWCDVKFEVVGKMILCQRCAGRIKRKMKKLRRISA